MERLTKRARPVSLAYVLCEVCGKTAITECFGERDCIQTLADRLAAIEDILGDTYDLDHLRELVEADKTGRCVVLPDGECSNKDGENALKSAMNTVFYHNNPVTRYIADAVAEKLTREEAEAALEKAKEATHG